MTTKSFSVCLYLVQCVLAEILEDLEFLVYQSQPRIAPPEFDDEF